MDRFFSAATKGDVEVLREGINKINVGELSSFFLGHKESLAGNLIHEAVKKNHFTFLSLALRILPPDVVVEYVCQVDTAEGSNPLHYAAKEGNIFTVKLLVNAYVTASTALGNQRIPPWLTKNSDGKTPLRSSLVKKTKKTHEYVARYLVLREHHFVRTLGEQMYPTLSVDQSSTMALDNTGASVLFCAMREGFSLLAEQILTSGLPYSLSSSHDVLENPLHHASKSNEQVSRLLLEKHPELIEEEPGNGGTVLDRAVEENVPWLVKLMLIEDEGSFRNGTRPWNKSCRRLIWHINASLSCDTPLHIAARKGYIDIVKLLVQGYESAIRDEAEQWDVPEAHHGNDHLGVSPLNIENSQKDTPLLVALKNKHDDLGVYLLSVDTFNMGQLRDREGSNAYEIAVQNGCEKSRILIFEKSVRIRAEDLLNQGCYPNDMLHPNILKIVQHFASGNTAMNEMLRSETVRMLAMELLSMLERDSTEDANSPLKEAAEKGAYWLVKLFLEPDSSLMHDSTPAWQIACRDGHLPILFAFVEQCSQQEFINLRQSNQQTLLHHISLLQYEQYKSLLENPVIQKLKNQLDSNGATPLHRAIERNDVGLTQALLETEGIQVDIQDQNHKTAVDLIEERCTIRPSDLCWYELYKKLLTNPDRLQKMKNRRGSSGATPLHIVIEWDDLKLAKTLVHAKGIELGIRNRNEKTALDLIGERCDQNSSLWYELYKEFLDNPNYVHELKNRQVGIEIETPLHRAIKWDDIRLAKTLLETKGVELDIEDRNGNTALDLLEERYYNYGKWFEMCRELMLDPCSKVLGLKYLLRRTTLKDMSNTLSVVAALLATITFAAGLTVPGGVDKDGTATLGTKPVFLVFLIANTVAMCSSMTVLFMMIGAMIWEAHPQANVLIDLCVSLLHLSLCGTIVAFMTGVYAIIAPKVIWAAIIVIILCLLGILLTLDVATLFWPFLHMPFKLMRRGVLKLVSNLRYGNFCGSEASSDDDAPFVPCDRSIPIGPTTASLQVTTQ